MKQFYFSFFTLIVFVIFLPRGSWEEIQTTTVKNPNYIENSKESCTLLENYITDQLKTPSPSKFIRAKYGQGCLDAGNGLHWGNWAHVHRSGACPNETWLHWKLDSNNQSLVSGNPSTLYKQQGHQNCLDCWNYEEECEIKSTYCFGGLNQKWQIRIYPSQIDNVNQKIYFSILSQLKFPPRDGNFTIVSGKISSPHCLQVMDKTSHNYGLLSGKVCSESAGDICLRLKRCNGNFCQSFYVDGIPWMDFLHLIHMNSFLTTKPTVSPPSTTTRKLTTKLTTTFTTTATTVITTTAAGKPSTNIINISTTEAPLVFQKYDSDSAENDRNTKETTANWISSNGNFSRSSSSSTSSTIKSEPAPLILYVFFLLFSLLICSVGFFFMWRKYNSTQMALEDLSNQMVSYSRKVQYVDDTDDDEICGHLQSELRHQQHYYPISKEHLLAHFNEHDN